MGELVHIRGTNLYVEEFGENNEEVLLYLHGGPGASCLDFCYEQANLLGGKLRVIAFDQRGVLRSDPIKENTDIGLNDIIADCEALREQLGIQSWTVLGHSFGGYIGLKYAHEHPSSVKKVIYEAPTFDLGLSSKSMIKRALLLLDAEHEYNRYIQQDSYTTKDLWHAISKVYQELGEEKKDSIYLKSIKPQELNSIYEKAQLPAESWGRSQKYIQKLEEEGMIFESLLPIIPLVNQPSLLLHGKFDPILCEHQKTYFMKNAPSSKTVVFEHSAHFPRLEEPQKYRDEVVSFVLEAVPSQ
ncbi:alpha/beta fold hydrolase [Sutcliffiella horikoshii]|uniref:alpha/beta fold hydrolase n=1 Tax=Sutcliffiella horikoshii TaxID=79883 RepID=UPI001F1D4582|nr:alpha/beta hydrolase [Sutcliffiella horikoshii]MCG1023479.1 alpha/beta hydrolase [Sutcliffiella horikoshii]